MCQSLARVFSFLADSQSFCINYRSVGTIVSQFDYPSIAPIDEA